MCFFLTGIEHHHVHPESSLQVKSTKAMMWYLDISSLTRNDTLKFERNAFDKVMY